MQGARDEHRNVVGKRMSISKMQLTRDTVREKRVGILRKVQCQFSPDVSARQFRSEGSLGRYSLRRSFGKRA
jgi:hypothetical protein